MKNPQENKLSMYIVLSEYLSTVPAQTIASMPQFEQFFADFNANVQKLRSKSEYQSASRIGYSRNKTEGKEETITYANNMAACISAYALSIGNEVLAEELKFTKSGLAKQRDTKTADDANFILTKGIEYLEFLSPFGIKQQQIDKLTDVLAYFNANIPLPRARINARKLLTKQIADLFITNDLLLKRMDSLVNTLELTDNTFYTSYYFSRRIVNNNGRKLSLRGFVLDTNGNPIVGVKVEIPTIRRVAKTTEKGYYEFKNLPAGFQNLIFNRVDYIETSRLVGIVSGQRVQLDVTLEATENKQDVA